MCGYCITYTSKNSPTLPLPQRQWPLCSSGITKIRSLTLFPLWKTQACFWSASLPARPLRQAQLCNYTILQLNLKLLPGPGKKPWISLYHGEKEQCMHSFRITVEINMCIRTFQKAYSSCGITRTSSNAEWGEETLAVTPRGKGWQKIWGWPTNLPLLCGARRHTWWGPHYHYHSIN